MDPAGPRFVDGPYVDSIPELAENILSKVKLSEHYFQNNLHIQPSKESAAFVDVIHTNGGFEPCVVCTTCNFLNNIIVAKVN